MIYFDNSATTLQKPKIVCNEIFRGISSEQFGNPGRAAHSIARNALNELFVTRTAIAKLFNIKNPLSVALCQNASAALNFVIKSLFQKDDHIITTEMEHNSVLRPLYQLQEQGADLSIIKFSPDMGHIEYESIEEKIQKNTKAIIVNHGSNVVGTICDLDFIYNICKKHSLILIIDASQTTGTMQIDLSKYQNTILCFTGHKSLYGPQGTGGIVINGDFKFKSVFSGGSGVHSFSHNHPQEFPDIFEIGTMNVPSFMGLTAGCNYVLETGLEKVSKKLFELRKYFLESVKAIPNIKIYGDYADVKTGPVISINIGNIFSGEISHVLDEDYLIATRPGAHCAPLLHERLGTKEQGVVRFSFSSFNTIEEIEKAKQALIEISN